jgi:transcriptional regulator with XRE-family HTH domain
MLYRHALGEVLREERHAQGKTLRTISGTGRIALGYLSEIERGDKEISSEILAGVADALGLQTSDIIIRAGLRMAGLLVPDTAETLLDEYADLVVRS